MSKNSLSTAAVCAGESAGARWEASGIPIASHLAPADSPAATAAVLRGFFDTVAAERAA